jgi:hypothetical protein
MQEKDIENLLRQLKEVKPSSSFAENSKRRMHGYI